MLTFMQQAGMAAEPFQQSAQYKSSSQQEKKSATAQQLFMQAVIMLLGQLDCALVWRLLIHSSLLTAVVHTFISETCNR